MRFEVRAVVDGARLGLVSGLGAKGASLETPACLVYSHVGCVPHLTSDLLTSLADLPQCLYLPLPELAGHQDILENNDDGISKFFVSVWATGGRVQLTAARFISLIEAVRPDCYFVQPARRAQCRTLQFLDDCLALQARSQVFAHFLMIIDVIAFVRKLAIKPISGFALLGRQSWPDELLTAVVTELPEDKLRLVCGIGEPSAVLDCVRRGVDLFEGHYPQVATACGYALTFYYPGLTAGN
uniref:Queuine tRNA-ribosyltransferase accessory subunit 2 n=1 Tax=Eptatretus burgeri TaxID=7764 RepID=A0A8C4QB78_EPTBU